MATIQRAVRVDDDGTEHPVVIKRILPALARHEHFLRMFVEEARLSSLLRHPNIVRVHDFGIEAGTLFIAMELVDGLSLVDCRRRLGRKAVLPYGAATYVVHQVCLGLAYAHRLAENGRALGLVHRDVSPANIMIAVSGEVKLLDFGIAPAADAGAAPGEPCSAPARGKWSYMSPEQVEGQQVTARSDIFAAGIVLWELLTGRRLFKASSAHGTCTNILQARIPPPSELRAGTPPLLDEICARALARSPAERYADAGAMAADLQRVLIQQPYGPRQMAEHLAALQPSRRGLPEVPRGRLVPRDPRALTLIGALLLVLAALIFILLI